jgi:hypothetical protein
VCCIAQAQVQAPSLAPKAPLLAPQAPEIAANAYLIFDTTVLAKDTAALTLGITLGATDVLSANCSIANVSINVFGSEVY